MRKIKIATLVLLTIISIRSEAQECKFILTGTIIDPHETTGLNDARLYIEEINKQVYADSLGFFAVSNLCKGSYHLTFNHSSCEEKKLFINLMSDTLIIVELEHHGHFLQSVTIEGTRTGSEGASQNIIRRNEIEKHSGEPLATLLEQVTGVSSFKNGSGIAKPIINGLSGNRISILNNGLNQAGQQWGSDHAPEIDPFSVEQIKVIKGVDVIPYGGNSLGGIVLLEPSSIPKDPHLHGAQLASFQTNGNLVAYSSKLEISKKKWDVRWTLGGKIGGDRSTPDYYLSNTGLKELSSSVFLIKDKPHQSSRIYLSVFNTELGILRGSHIGNVTDLQEAITKDVPFFTKDNFSYQIESPEQKVGHYLSKYSFQKEINKHFVEFIVAGQINHRREYDVRRSGRSSTPALDLFMQSYSAEIKDKLTLGKSNLIYGLQTRYNINNNVEGTGIFPLIPNYQLYNVGTYMQWKNVHNRISYELGIRYDKNYFIVSYQTKDIPKTIEQRSHDFDNYNFAGGLKYKVASPWILRLNLGRAQRSPEINELYSSGLHQAVAGIEEGNINLIPEKSLKVMLTSTTNLSHRFIFEASAYYQQISDYIYLEPQKDYRLTIRGAFPLFVYKQTDARIYGIDLLAKIDFTDHISWVNRASLIKSKDVLTNSGIPNIPPHQLNSSIHYTINKLEAVKNIDIELGNKYVFKRTDLQPEQDFLASPDAYYLMNARLQFDCALLKQSVNFSLQVDNLLNNTYRDYLNRLRYFSDEEGINVKFGIKMSF
ncbi:MAG: TonB-dependent receptor [Saprospiraceae bacterium]